METTFAEEHEKLKKNLEIINVYKTGMIIVVASIVGLFIDLIVSVMKYHHGGSLYGFGVTYVLLFLFVGFYFLFLKLVKWEEKEYTEEWKVLFQKYFKV